MAGDQPSRIRELLLNGVSHSQICAALGVVKSTVSYHARLLGLERRIPKDPIDWEAVDEYRRSHTSDETRKHFGISGRRYMIAFREGLVAQHRLPSIGRYRVRAKQSTRQLRRLTIETLEQSTNPQQVKRFVIAHGLLPLECQMCSLTSWRGQPLDLHLDHKDGNRLNNHLDNLRLLCPNCHSQTPTYGYKNRLTRRERQDGAIGEPLRKFSANWADERAIELLYGRTATDTSNAH